VIAILLAACGGDPAAPEQPIAFNHAIHVGEEKIPCTDCHVGAETGTHATLPALSRCLLCHMKPQGDEPNERERVVRELASQRTPVKWIQVTRNAGHVYFSHRAHVTLAKMPCADCHGDVAAWEAPPTSPNQALRSMDACLACHRAQGASTECATCHQ
jgi:c(7)-type cytochrome triheme protein